MDKKVIVDRLRAQILAQYQRSLAALEGSREAATGDDSKAENKYDTRGLEASYLAVGQAELADLLGRSLDLFDTAAFPELDFDDPVAPGALVEVDREGVLAYYLLAPAGGGVTCETGEGETVTILGPGSPLRSKLEGKRAGESLHDPPLSILEVF